MKCPKCGKEIADDSNFCEYCGTKVHKTSRNTLWGLLLLMAIVLVLGIMFITGNLFGEMVSDSTSMEFVDLGLPSGTRWATSNESNLMDYDYAVRECGESLPTKDQWEELKDQCRWTWTKSGYKVTGLNGNSIFLPAAGGRTCGGSVFSVGSYGNYWSSSASGSEIAWRLYFHSDSVYMDILGRCYGLSVRLVQDN